MQTLIPLIVSLILLCSNAYGRDLTIPDPKLTPGVARTDITQANICKTKWGKDHRFVTAAMKKEVFKNYGLKGNLPTSWCRKDKHGRVFEIDHSCSREIGGADDVKNLWPECYSGKWNATLKDKLENRLHKEMCAGTISLQDAQAAICVHDWRKAYRHYFGEPR